MEKCGKKHSAHKNYECVKEKGHDGWCGCAPSPNRYNITVYSDNNNDVIQGDTESLVSLARAILTAAESKRTSSLLTRWGLLRVENADALNDFGEGRYDSSGGYEIVK